MKHRTKISLAILTIFFAGLLHSHNLHASGSSPTPAEIRQAQEEFVNKQILSISKGFDLTGVGLQVKDRLDTATNLKLKELADDFGKPGQIQINTLPLDALDRFNNIPREAVTP